MKNNVSFAIGLNIVTFIDRFSILLILLGAVYLTARIHCTFFCFGLFQHVWKLYKWLADIQCNSLVNAASRN